MAMSAGRSKGESNKTNLQQRRIYYNYGSQGLVIIVATDALVLKHQAISNQNADSFLILRSISQLGPNLQIRKCANYSYQLKPWSRTKFCKCHDNIASVINAKSVLKIISRQMTVIVTCICLTVTVLGKTNFAVITTTLLSWHLIFLSWHINLNNDQQLANIYSMTFRQHNKDTPFFRMKSLILQGLEPGKTYRNEKACNTFAQFIAQTEKESIAKGIETAEFISLTSDGATDSSRTEQELVVLRYALNGIVNTRYAGIESPKSPDAPGIYAAILDAISTVGISEDTLRHKLVGFGCDGACVMLGAFSGVAKLMKDIQPSTIVVHCLAHRLELAYKDAVKGIKVYESVIILLMGLYYCSWQTETGTSVK